jgi:multiple sugar transport system substrate-binding protein
MKKYIIFLLALSLLALSCGGDKPQTTIAWWQFWTDATIKPVLQEIIAEFEAAYPGVKVDLVDLTWADGHDKIAIAFSSGSAPDVVELGSDWIPEFSSTGHLFDITETVVDIRENYYMWDPAIYQDRVYAVPWILGTRVLYANVDLLTQAGYEADFSPADWNALIKASREINDIDGVYGFGSNAAERHRLYKKFLPFLWSNGGQILSDDGTTCLLDAQIPVRALQYYSHLCNLTGLTDTQRRLEDAFLEGKIGFVISGDWLLKRIGNEKPDFNFSTHLIPPPETGMPSVSFAGGEYLAISSQSEHPDIAFALVMYICSVKNQLRFCQANRTTTPAAKDAAADEEFASQPHFATFIRQLETSRMPPAHPQWVYIEGELEKAIEAVLYAKKTPMEAFQDACFEIEQILQR